MNVQIKKVLVIEDEEDIANGTVAVLASLDGVEPKQVSNKEDAVKLIRRWLPDVVVLDLKIPDCLANKITPRVENGVELALQIDAENRLRRNCNIQIIIVSASVKDPLMQMLADHLPSVFSYIEKTGEKSKLAWGETVKEAVGSALGSPVQNHKTIIYDGFDGTLVELRDVSGVGALWANIIEREILGPFDKSDYRGCVVCCEALLKDVIDELIWICEQKSSHAIITRQSAYLQNKDNPMSYNWQKLNNLVFKVFPAIDKGNGKVVCPDSSAAYGIKDLRSVFGHPEKTNFESCTIGYATTAMQLLILILNRYVQFKRK